MNEFFDQAGIKIIIRNFINRMNNLHTDNKFESQRNELIRGMLMDFLDKPEQWDKIAQFNIQNIGSNFLQEVHSTDINSKTLNNLFTSCFRFALEGSMFENNINNQLFKSTIDFATYRAEEFDGISKNQILYALREMPISIVRSFIKISKLSDYHELIARLDQAKNLQSDWDEKLDERQEKINEMNEVLSKQESAFNFVGLYDGFSRLGQIKINEQKWARRVFLFLGIIMPTPLLLELSYLIFTKNPVGNLEHLIKAIPVLSITLILIYYFRIALSNYNSVRAQMMQIELRKSLCQFIQSYSEYSKKINTENQNLLSKFEDVVFSNIMTSEDKIPSTFDGVDQIASLISSIKGSGK